VGVKVRNQSDPCGVETWIRDFPHLADSTIPFASTPLSREMKSVTERLSGSVHSMTFLCRGGAYVRRRMHSKPRSSSIPTESD